MAKIIPVKTKLIKSKIPKILNNNKNLIDKMYAKKLDQMEIKYNLTSSELNIPDRLSTGLLTFDLLIGGGLCAGTMVQISGQEKGGKSTSCITMLGAAVTQQVRTVAYWDAENSLNSPSWCEGILSRKVHDIFFGTNKLARLYQESVLEDFYNSSRFLMQSLPDKIYRTDLKSWFFVFDSDKPGRALMAECGYKSYETQLYRQTGRLWCPTDIKGLQGIIFIDSYPSLVTASSEDETKNEDKILPALNARAFADNIRKIKGRLKRKGFIVVGVNQIRTNPFNRFGSSDYEPGGMALKMHSDVRLQNRPRSVPVQFGWTKGTSSQGTATGEYGEERSVTGDGMDRYAYVYIQNTKNKVGTPFLGAWSRIWFSDYKSDPHGFDIAFDTYTYLKMTGRVKGSVKGKKGLFVDLGKFYKGNLSWLEFKLMILAESSKSRELKAKALKTLRMKALPPIRTELFKELKSGKAYEMISKLNIQNEEDVESNE